MKRAKCAGICLLLLLAATISSDVLGGHGRRQSSIRPAAVRANYRVSDRDWVVEWCTKTNSTLQYHLNNGIYPEWSIQLAPGKVLERTSLVGVSRIRGFGVILQPGDDHKLAFHELRREINEGKLVSGRPGIGYHPGMAPKIVPVP